MFGWNGDKPQVRKMKFTNEQIQRIAREQSASELNCDADDFLKPQAVITDFCLREGARVYYKEPIACNFVSYGGNVVAASKPEIKEIVAKYINRYEYYHLFETPNLLWLNEKLAGFGQKVCFMAYYFLPDVNKLKRLDCPYEIKLLHPEDLENLYTKEWSNALCKDRKELDVLACGAYDGDKLIGLAGCSADCENMWQIGVDVLPEYRKQGIASALTSNLAVEILERGKVPFYCCAWSNIPSAKNAVRSGFAPAWAEMTVKPADFVDKLNDNMDYLIREMKDTEYGLLDDFLYEAIFIPDGVEPPPKDIIKNEELQVYVKNFGKEPHDKCFVAEVDGKIVGAVWVRIMDDYGHIDNETPSFAISLYKKYRSYGIGTAMMKKMLDHLRGRGYKQASLAVQKANYAVKMYLSVGFNIVDENAEEYIMVCKLN